MKYMRSIAISLLRQYVCCPSLNIYLKNQTFNEVYDECCLWPWLGPSLVTLRCRPTSGFVDDVMFAHTNSSPASMARTRHQLQL